MILLESGGYLSLFLLIYGLAHSPAIIMLIIGIIIRKEKPETAKRLFLIATLYFIVGGGICGSMFL